MKKKVHFFQSVNFKIALSFILLLLIAIQIIGGYFIRELEATTISDFKKKYGFPGCPIVKYVKHADEQQRSRT